MENHNSKERIPIVSIVIVCMNNLENLRPCLDSIKMYTQVEYETFVVAYLFSGENLECVKKEYPWVILIESNEIRGFSENNNLALRQAKGKYCLVLNDDTEMKMPVVDRLVDSFSRCPENTAIVSPVLLNANGDISVCGRNKITWREFIFREWGVKLHKMASKYVDQNGLFQSFNVIGAAFLIRTDLFRMIGWFDERFFFCPEDIAVSTTLNRLGYTCYVDADVLLYHYEGLTSKSLSLVQTATRPAGMMGSIIFYCEGRWYRRWILIANLFLSIPLHFIFHYIKGFLQDKPNENQVLAIADKNRLRALFMRKTPKDTFIYFLQELSCIKECSSV